MISLYSIISLIKVLKTDKISFSLPLNLQKISEYFNTSSELLVDISFNNYITINLISLKDSSFINFSILPGIPSQNDNKTSACSVFISL